VSDDRAVTYEFENVRCTKRTDKAIYVEAPDLDPIPCRKSDLDRCWLPLSAVHDDSEVYEVGHHGKLVVHAWIVDKKKSQPADPTPGWVNLGQPARGREVPTPAVLLNRPLRPPGRK
jgi:hypothetical protein